MVDESGGAAEGARGAVSGGQGLEAMAQGRREPRSWAVRGPGGWPLAWTVDWERKRREKQRLQANAQGFKGPGKVLNLKRLTGGIPRGAVYIGRRRGGRWGNPYREGRHGSRERVVEMYRKWLWAEIVQGHVTRRELQALDGKDLVCHCAPEACHGYVLRKAVEWACRLGPHAGWRPDL